MTASGAPGASASFGALRHRNFRLFIFGKFVSLCGVWMQTVALGWLALTLTNSALQVSLVTTLASLPVLLFTIYGGVLADRVNRRRALLLLQAGFIAEALALGFLTASGRVTIGWIYVIAFFGGLATAFEIPMRQSYLGELVGRGDLMSAIALNSSAFNVSRVVGPALAGTILSVTTPAVAFFLNAAAFIAVLVALILIRPVPPPPDAVPMRRAGLREGIAHILGSAWPRTVVAMISVVTIFATSFLAILPVFARDVLHTGAGGYGALISMFGVGAAAAALSIAAVGHRFRLEATALWAPFALGVALVLLGLTHVFALALPLVLLAGLCMALGAIMSNTLLQTGAPDHLRGQVVGFYSFIVVGMAPFGSLEAGWISEHAGTPAAIILGGTVCFLVAAIQLWRMFGRRAGAAGAGSEAREVGEA